MPEMPPMIPPSPGEPDIENMTLEELGEKIKALDKDLEYWYAKNTEAGGRKYQTVISQKTNERARYDMRRQELLRKGSGNE